MRKGQPCQSTQSYGCMKIDFGVWIQWNGIVDWNGGMEWNVDSLDGFNGFSPPYNDHL